MAFAGSGRKAHSINHSDVAATVANQTGVLQAACCLNDALAPDTERPGDLLLGHGYRTRRYSIKCRKQPTAQLLLHPMMTIASRHLHHLCHQALGIAQQQPLQ